MKDERIICVSGAADIIKPGLIKMLRAASEYGKVVFILNSDEWIEREKGWKIFSWEERKEMLLGTKYVDAVEPVDDKMGGSISEALIRIRPDYYGTGRTQSEGIIEADLCRQLNISVKYGLGGPMTDKSSKELIDDVVIQVIDKMSGWLRRGAK